MKHIYQFVLVAFALLLFCTGVSRAQEREKELSGRETTLDERLGAVRSDLAALKGL